MENIDIYVIEGYGFLLTEEQFQTIDSYYEDDEVGEWCETEQDKTISEALENMSVHRGEKKRFMTFSETDLAFKPHGDSNIGKSTFRRMLQPTNPTNTPQLEEHFSKIVGAELKMEKLVFFVFE